MRITLSLLLSLLGVAHAEPPAFDWHIGWSDGDSAMRPKISYGDEDADGKPERRAAMSSIGSGWKTYVDCVRHGASGHEACRLESSTAYAWFSGDEVSLNPKAGNLAARLLKPVRRRPAAAPTDPHQGAMWALGHVNDSGVVGMPRWVPGRPPTQSSVRLTMVQAATLRGGVAWDPSGNLPREKWSRITVTYSAGWPQWTGGGQARSFAPRKVGSAPQVEIWQHGHALAVYDIVENRHAWVFHQPPNGGFKLDRWLSIAKVEFVGGALVVESKAQGTVRIPLKI